MKTAAHKPAKKPVSLKDELIRIKGLLAQLTTSWPVQRMSESELDQIERLSKSGNTLMRQLEKELQKAFSKIKQPEDHQPIADAYAIYAEARVSLLLQCRGIHLDRTPGTGRQKQKRPDFVYRTGTKEALYFEVKCLDFEGGINRHTVIANDALEVQSDLNERAKKPGIHFGEIEISPFGDAQGTTDRIEILIDKISNNIKRDQITYGPTVLVVEMGRIQADAHDPSSLVPVYYNHDYPCSSCVSGELWQIVLGRLEDQIYKLPGFEGETNLDRPLEKEGILRQFPELFGVTFVIPELSGRPKVYSIWNEEPTSFNSKSNYNMDPNMVGGIIHQYSDAWNDPTNMNGYKYSLCRC